MPATKTKSSKTTEPKTSKDKRKTPAKPGTVDLADMPIEIKKITDLQRAEYNPRTITVEELNGLEASFKKFGYIEPIVWNKQTGRIVGGHQRLKVLEKQGVEEVRVVVVDLSEEDEKTCNVTLNNPHAQGSFTPELQDLLVELRDVPEFEDLRLEDLVVEVVPPEDSEEKKEENSKEESKTESNIVIPEESVSREGDLWILGNHKLLCGDATIGAQVDRLFLGEFPGLIFADPPHDWGPKNLYKVFNNRTKDTHIFLMHSDRAIREYLRESPFVFQQFFILNLCFSLPQGSNKLGTLGPYKRHVLVCHEKTGKPTKFKNLHDSFASIISVKVRGNLREERFHPHQKSLDDLLGFISHYTEKRDVVYDPFSGAGTILLACEKLVLSCYAVEKEPKYCDTIVARWEHYTSEQATHEKTGKTFLETKEERSKEV